MDFYPNSDNSNTNDDMPDSTQNKNSLPPRMNGFAVASFICGILAVIVCCTGILGIPLGALSILFAVLSKRKGQPMPGMSMTGIWLSIVGVTLGILMTVYSFYMVFHDPFMREQVNLMMENMYGITLDEYLNIIRQ